MKKLLMLTFLLASMIFTALPAEAETANNTINSGFVKTQPRLWSGRRNVTNTSRLVRVGNRLYRYTYRTRYNRSGRVVSRQLISRIRIR